MLKLRKFKSLKKSFNYIKQIDKSNKHFLLVELLRLARISGQLNLLHDISTEYLSNYSHSNAYYHALHGYRPRQSPISLFNMKFNRLLQESKLRGNDHINYSLSLLNTHSEYDRVTLNIFIKHTLRWSLPSRSLWELYYLVMVREGHRNATLPPGIHMQFNTRHHTNKSKLEYLLHSSSKHPLNYTRHTHILYKYFIRSFKFNKDTVGYNHLLACSSTALKSMHTGT